MSAQKTGRRRLEKLSRAAEAAVLKRGVLARLKLAKCLKMLKELARFDEAGDLMRANYSSRGIISGVAFFVLLFLLLFLGIGFDLWEISIFLGFVALIAAAMVIHCVIRYRRLKNLDIANDFRMVLVPFLTAIREDVSSREKVKLKLDLAGPVDSKVTRKGAPASINGKQVQETVYSDPWCHLEVPLVAGNHITLDISNLYTCRGVTYRSSSGKHKRKFKWKKLVLVRAGMSSLPGRFAFDPVAIERKSGECDVKLKKQPESEAAAMKSKWKFKSSGSPPSDSIQPKEILDMFFRLGSLLRPVQTGSEKA